MPGPPPGKTCTAISLSFSSEEIKNYIQIAAGLNIPPPGSAKTKVFFAPKNFKASCDLLIGLMFFAVFVLFFITNTQTQNDLCLKDSSLNSMVLST